MKTSESRDAERQLRNQLAAVNGELRDDGMWLRCDAFGCIERHPLDHDDIGDVCFGNGRWLGWVYLDLNRPDLWERPVRFCSVGCLQWWLDRESITRRVPEPRTLTPLDRVLRAPLDEVAMQMLRKQHQEATARPTAQIRGTDA